MKSELLSEFAVDEKSKTVIVKREFLAGLELVWKAWTTLDLIERWFSPRPWITQTKAMDFCNGGYWHFSIVNPDGVRHWSRYDYKDVEFQKTIGELRAFTDESGIVSPEYPRTECTSTFNEMDSKTLVTITARYRSLDIFKKMASEGHKTGFMSTFNNLDLLLIELKEN